MNNTEKLLKLAKENPGRLQNRRQSIITNIIKVFVPDCRTGEEKKMSLLKRRTNFDNLKDLSAWNFAGKIDEFVQGDCDICPFSTMRGDVQECRLLDDRPTTCRRKYQQWLESEAEE